MKSITCLVLSSGTGVFGSDCMMGVCVCLCEEMDHGFNSSGVEAVFQSVCVLMFMYHYGGVIWLSTHSCVKDQCGSCAVPKSHHLRPVDEESLIQIRNPVIASCLRCRNGPGESGRCVVLVQYLIHYKIGPLEKANF